MGSISFFCVWAFSQFHFFEETILSSLCVLNTLVEDHLALYAHIDFWALGSFPLVYMSIFMPIPYYFNYCSFGIHFEMWQCDASSIVLLCVFRFFCGSV